MIRIPFVLTTLALLCLPAPLFASPVDVETDGDATSAAAKAPVRVISQTPADDGTLIATLSNGMTVIAKGVHTAPVVSVRAYVRAGGMWEGRWLGCGLSHLLEHLVAKDAISGDAGHMRTASAEAMRKRDLIGGQANAYTTLDHTCYYISAGAAKMPECIEMIASQVARPNFTEKDYRREHGVVQRELEMGMDDPGRIAYYAHQANVYQTHPAAVPVIGYARPLSEVSWEDIRDYHAMLYQPQNMFFVVAGDIDPQRAIDLVVEQVREFRRGRSHEYDLPAVAPVSGVRRLVKRSPAFQETQQWMSFLTIPLQHPDLYALDVLSHILSQGQASRLVQELQFKRKLVTSINTWSYTPTWGKGTFTIIFRTQPGRGDEVEQAVLEQLQKIIDEGVGEAEVSRAKRLKISEYVRGQQTAEDIAAGLARDLMTTGDLHFSKAYTDRIQAVTAEQVQAVAKKYLRFEDRVITRIDPADAPADAEAEADESEAEKDAETHTAIHTLDNGLRVVLHPSKEVGLVSMVLAVKGGLLAETPATNGLGSLMMTLSSRGAGGRNAREIAEFFNDAGGSVSGICGDNTFLYSASLLADRYDTTPRVAEAMNLFADIVLAPELPAEELETIRPLAMAAVKRIDESWTSLLQKTFRQRFFGDQPWAMLSSGSLEVIGQATPQQIRAYHDKHLRAGSAVLAVYGDFDPKQIEKIVTERFGKMPAGTADLPKGKSREIKPGGEVYVHKTTTKQAGIMVAAPGTTVGNLDDRLPLMLLDTIISGYRLPGGWLHGELRGKKLVYVVHAYQKSGLVPGAFQVYAGTQPEKAVEVVNIIRKNLRRAAEYTPKQEELDRATTTIVTAEVLGSQTVSDLATSAALDELYGLGADWNAGLEARLRAITPEQVQAAAKKYLADGYVVTVITPQPETFTEADFQNLTITE